ncbi:MAG: PAS domain S-box protein [Arenicellales bacterium]
MGRAQANAGKPLRILFVEDSGEDTAILLQELRDGGFEPQFERVDTAEAMRRAFSASVWDAVICDYAIPHFAIPEALKVLQESEHDLPFIVVAGRAEEESAIELMKAGAHDFVMKDNLERLVPALSREMTAAELRRQHTLAQALLGESELRFRILEAASPVGIFHTDAAGRCLYVNERWAQMAGMAPAAALEKGWEAAVHPDDREQVTAERDRCLAQNQPFSMEFRLRRPDGAVVWVLGRIEGQAGDAGQVVTWIGTVTDVTRLKTTQLQLTERVKEQRCLYSISTLAARTDLAEQDLLRESLPVIAAGFQYPDITCVRIYLEGREFAGDTFRESPRALASELRLGGAPAGRIEVCYRQERPAKAEGPFLAEERALLDTVARMLGRAIESRRSLDALSASEHHLREAQRIARLGSWTWDIEPNVVTWTRELYLIAGKDPALPAPTIAEQQSLYTPESWDRLSVALDRCISHGEPFELDLEVPRPEGNRWMTVHGHAHRDERGNVVRLQGTAMDITERKLAELAVESDERRFRALTENASDLVVIVDANGIITYTSPSLARLGGYAAGDARGRNFLEFLHPDDKAAGTQAMMKVLEQPDVPVVSELRFRHRDGRYVVLESASKNVLADPAVAGIVVNARDISERKAAEVEIASSEVRYRRLFEAARDGILLVNVDSGQIVDVNPFMIELLGYTREQYVDRKLWEIGPFKDVIASKAAFVELQKNRYVRYDDLPLRTVDGRNIDVEFVSNVYQVDGGEVIQCNIRDITERKQAERTISKLNRLYRTLSGINTAIVHTENAQDLFREACRVAVEQGRFSMAWVGMLDPADQSLKPVAFHGLTGDDVAALRQFTGEVALRSEPTAATFTGGEITYTPDPESIAGSDQWYADAVSRGVRGSTTLPLKRGQRVAGLFKLFTDEPDFFDPDQLQLLEEIAADLSFALDTLDAETHRREMEDKLRESELRYRSIFERAEDVIYMIGPDGRFAVLSPSFERITQWKPEEWIGRDFMAIIHPEDQERARGIFEQTVTNNASSRFEMRIAGKAGDYWFGEFNVCPIDIQGNRYLYGIGRDITERKRTDEALRASRNLLAAIVENAPIRIFWKDRELRYLGCNSTFAQDAGMSQPEDLLGKDDFQLPWREQAERYCADDRQVMDTDTPKIGFEEPQTTVDGTQVWLYTSKVPLHDADGKVFGMLGIYEDITERKRAEAEIRRMNWALRALSQSNSALVHAGSEEELFQSCCESIAGAEFYPLAWIGLARDEPGRPVVPAAVAGEAAAYVEGMKATWDDSPTGRGPTGTAIRTGVTQVVNDFESRASFAPWLDRARAHGLASSISLPIRDGDTTIGALMVYSREVSAFTETESGLFEELADDVGFGVVVLRTRKEHEAGLIERGKQAVKLREIMESAIEALAATVEQRDPYTGGHQRRVADLAVAIGREMGLAEEQLEGLHVASVIHDIGKIYVPAEILARPGRLSDAEFEIVKSHPQVGYDIIKGVDFPWPVAQIIYQHHERLDGSGYPLGVKGDEIIVEARILAVADIVEAMSSHRPYRTGLGLDAALEQVQKEAGSKLDSTAVRACVRLFREKGYKLSV